MMKMFATTALVLAMSAAAIAPSHAQSSVPAGRMMGMAGGGCPMMGMMGPGMMRRGMMGQGPTSSNEEQMGALADRRLVNLKTKLKITDGQADVWKAYTEAVKVRATVMQGMRNSMEAMVESMKAVKPATEKLYAALTAEQKTVADRLVGVACGAM